MTTTTGYAEEQGQIVYGEPTEEGERFVYGEPTGQTIQCGSCGPVTRFEHCPSSEECAKCAEGNPDFDGRAHHPDHHEACERCAFVPEGIALWLPPDTEAECVSWAAMHNYKTGHRAVASVVRPVLRESWSPELRVWVRESPGASR